MKSHIRLIVFYSCNELSCKDIERELYSNAKERFHFFFFHNRELHFSKVKVLEDNLLEQFNLVPPEMKFLEDEKTLIMVKKIDGFSFQEFDEIVDEQYTNYIDRITYRVECIFQTFTIFNRLYADRSIISLVPIEIQDRYIEILNKNNFSFEKIDLHHELMKRYDVTYWSNYFTRIEDSDYDDGALTRENIKDILLINN